MYRNKKVLFLYFAFSVLALIAMWRENSAYLHLGFLEGNAAFWRDAFVNPASRSITIDIFFLYFTVLTWMIVDSKEKRLLKFMPAYCVIGLLVGVSFTTPIYFIHREFAKTSKA